MQTYEELLAENAALKVENATLKARVAELEARLAALEAMLAMSSAVTPLVTVFLVHAKRGTVAAKELLGSFAGILVSDRWSAYSFVDAVRRQLCWAHLLRDFEWIAEFGGEAAATGKAPVERAKRMFQWWHEFKAGSLSRSGFQQRMAPLMERLEALLEEGVASAHKKTAGKCRKILELRAALWTFVRLEGVEPTLRQRGGAGLEAGGALAKGELRVGQPARRAGAVATAGCLLVSCGVGAERLPFVLWAAGWRQPCGQRSCRRSPGTC